MRTHALQRRHPEGRRRDRVDGACRGPEGCRRNRRLRGEDNRRRHADPNPGGVLQTGEFDTPSIEAPAGGEIQHPDGYTIRSSAKEVTITGGSARGVLYGAYDFIERVLGVRWFMPAALGEDIVPQDSIPFPALNRDLEPRLPQCLRVDLGGWPRFSRLELRVRAKIGPSLAFGHNWSAILAPTTANRTQYPLAFAEVDGRRAHPSSSAAKTRTSCA